MGIDWIKTLEGIKNSSQNSDILNLNNLLQENKNIYGSKIDDVLFLLKNKQEVFNEELKKNEKEKSINYDLLLNFFKNFFEQFEKIESQLKDKGENINIYKSIFMTKNGEPTEIFKLINNPNTKSLDPLFVINFMNKLNASKEEVKNVLDLGCGTNIYETSKDINFALNYLKENYKDFLSKKENFYFIEHFSPNKSKEIIKVLKNYAHLQNDDMVDLLERLLLRLDSEDKDLNKVFNGLNVESKKNIFKQYLEKNQDNNKLDISKNLIKYILSEDKLAIKKQIYEIDNNIFNLNAKKSTKNNLKEIKVLLKKFPEIIFDDNEIEKLTNKDVQSDEFLKLIKSQFKKNDTLEFEQYQIVNLIENELLRMEQKKDDFFSPSILKIISQVFSFDDVIFIIKDTFSMHDLELDFRYIKAQIKDYYHKAYNKNKNIQYVNDLVEKISQHVKKIKEIDVINENINSLEKIKKYLINKEKDTESIIEKHIDKSIIIWNISDLVEHDELVKLCKEKIKEKDLTQINNLINLAQESLKINPVVFTPLVKDKIIKSLLNNENVNCHKNIYKEIIEESLRELPEYKIEELKENKIEITELIESYLDSNKENLNLKLLDIDLFSVNDDMRNIIFSNFKTKINNDNEYIKKKLSTIDNEIKIQKKIINSPKHIKQKQIVNVLLDNINEKIKINEKYNSVLAIVLAERYMVGKDIAETMTNLKESDLSRTLILLKDFLKELENKKEPNIEKAYVKCMKQINKRFIDMSGYQEIVLDKNKFLNALLEEYGVEIFKTIDKNYIKKLSIDKNNWGDTDFILKIAEATQEANTEIQNIIFNKMPSEVKEVFLLMKTTQIENWSAALRATFISEELNAINKGKTEVRQKKKI